MPDNNQTSVSSVAIEKSFDLPGVAFCCATGSTPGELYFGCSDANVYRIDLSAEKPAAQSLGDAQHTSYVTGIVNAGGSVVSAAWDGSIVWWDAETHTMKHRVEAAHAGWIRRLIASPDTAIIASVADDMKTRLWHAESAERLADWGDYEEKTPHGYPSMLYAAAFSHDGKLLATGDKTGRVLIREVPSGHVVATLETPVMYTWDPKARRHSIGGIRSLAFSSDSSLLAVGGMGKVGNIDHLGGKSRIEVFDWKKAERTYEIEDDKFKGLVERLQFAPSDEWLVAAGGDHGGFISVYAMNDGKLLAQEKAPMHIHDFTAAEDVRQLLSVGHGKGCVVRLTQAPS